MNDILISICITSYNRPLELKRCLESIDVSDNNLIEIIISEDLSPKRNEIQKVVNAYKNKIKYKVIDNYNEKNLGYDRNLSKLISLSNGKYILFCSDDDVFNPNQLDEIIQYFVVNKNVPMLYTSFTSSDTFSTNRYYSTDFIIAPGEKSASKYIYDGILFSGLIFKRDLIKDYDAEKFVNLNYFQIYLLLKVIYHYGAHYINNSLINCIGDGENGYGTTELSNNDKLLANRKSIYSNIQFNKGLVKVIKIFDEGENTSILDKFAYEYSLRSYRGLSRARDISRKSLNEYWKFLHTVGIDIKNIARMYYLMLYFTNTKFCDKLVSLPKRVLFKIRGN